MNDKAIEWGNSEVIRIQRERIAVLEAALREAIKMIETGTYPASSGATFFWETSPPEVCLTVLEIVIRKASHD